MKFLTHIVTSVISIIYVEVTEKEILLRPDQKHDYFYTNIKVEPVNSLVFDFSSQKLTFVVNI